METTTRSTRSSSLSLFSSSASGSSFFSSPISIRKKLAPFSLPSNLGQANASSSGDEDGASSLTVSPNRPLERKATATMTTAANTTTTSSSWRARSSSFLRKPSADTVTIVEPNVRSNELLALLSDELHLRNLMHRLLAKADNDGAVRVRFVSYVTQYENETNASERKRKAKGLEDMFLSENARCKLDELPITLHGEPSRAKQFIMNQLITHHGVLDFIPSATNSRRSSLNEQ